MRTLSRLPVLCCATLVICAPHLARATPSTAAPASSPAAARSLVRIDRTVVELKDLFRNAGPNANVVLGPGPAPGARITVGIPQLSAIAAQYSVPWSPGDRQSPVIIERPGLPIERERIISALEPALLGAGAPRHIIVSIDTSHLPMIPPGSTPDIAVNRISYDRTTGNFQGNLLIKSPTTAGTSVDVSGLATPAIQAVVATETLTPGEILTGANVKLGWIASQSRPSHLLTDLAQAIGMEVNRTVSSDTPLSTRTIITPLLINRGAMVSLAVVMPGLEVTTRGIAMEAGGAGSVISVMNPTSREIVQAVIDGPDRAHVIPGSMPTRPQSTTPYYNAGTYAR